MPDATSLAVPYPSLARKKITAAFDGGRLTSDSGVMLLSLAERRRGIARSLAALINDPRDAAHITHTVEDVLRARVFAIACGYPDGNDLNWLRSDPAFKLACGRLPETGADLCSQPTISRWENAPGLREIIRLTYVLIDIWCQAYKKPPFSVILDIDDTVDVAHGHQKMTVWNTHYGERCFLPIHIYDTATGRPVTMILRPGKTPSGAEVRRWLRRLIKRIRRHWPNTHIIIRGDGHYGRDEAMSWCEDNGVDYIFGFAGNSVLDRLVDAEADDIRTRRAKGQLAVLRGKGICWPQSDKHRGWAETRYAAKSWVRERRVVARIEAKESDEDDMLRRGIDIRYVVTSLTKGTAEHIYATVYCARGQAENLIKQHKAQLASDRTSCRAPLANQFRLILHTAAYWLLLDIRDQVPSSHPLRQSEFGSIRLHLLKIAGRVVETASRVRVALASCCPHADVFRYIALRLQPAGP